MPLWALWSMARRRRRSQDGVAPRRTVTTPEFRHWLSGLDHERKVKITGAMAYIAKTGPTLGRPHVDVIHGSRVNKLKEARIDRGTRALFAFDSNQDLVMLVGGDKTGKWNRWYPEKIRHAERAYHDHERRIGKEPRCLSQRAAKSTTARGGR